MPDLNLARKQEIRACLLDLLAREYPGGVGAALLVRGLEAYRVSLDEVKQEIDYLAKRQLVRDLGDSAPCVTALAIDLLEQGNDEPSLPIPRMPDRERFRREELRWRFIRCADVARPYPLSELMAQRVAHDLAMPVSQRESRAILTYLEEKGLVEIRRSPSYWLYSLTHQGVDCTEYTQQCPIGVGRPPQGSDYAS